MRRFYRNGGLLLGLLLPVSKRLLLAMCARCSDINSIKFTVYINRFNDSTIKRKFYISHVLDRDIKHKVYVNSAND